jgi:pentatricopeptide repeat-containing protein PET309
LETRGNEFDRAWVFYLAARQPQTFRSSLCAYLSRSSHRVDQDRAWQLFEQIPPENRSADDFLHITESQLRAEEPWKIKSICEEAVSRGFADSCCALTCAFYVKKNDWINALDIVQLGVQGKPLRRYQQMLSQLDHLTLPDVAIQLGDFLTNQLGNKTALRLAHFLVEHITKSLELLERISIDILLQMLRLYNRLGLLKGAHYFDMIRALQSSTTRSNVVRAVVFYRHLRWQMPEVKPPAKILSHQISALASFDITNGIQLFLDELSQFYQKPSIEAYRQAMMVYSRAGDVEKVDAIFERLVADYGPPRSRHQLTPLLYVHARIGNVQETHDQFRRIAEEFHLTPNTVCWNILLKAYAVTNDPSGALSVFSEMLKDGVPPDSHTFGTLMGICANRGDVGNTRWLLREAQKRQVQITMPMLDTVVQVYCNNGRLDLAEKFAKAATRLKVEGSPMRMWNTLLLQHAFRMDVEAFRRVKRRMDRANLSPDATTYAASMLSLVLMNRPDQARQLLRNLHKKRIIHATEYHYAIILYGYLKVQNRDMVHIIFNEISQRFGRAGTKSSLLKLKSDVERDLQIMKDEGSRPRGGSLRLETAERFLMSAISRVGTNSSSSELSLLGVSGDSSTKTFSTLHYEYLIKQYGKGGALKRARELFHEYGASDPSQSSVENGLESAPFGLVNAMMVAHLQAEEYESVEKCWQIQLPRAIKMASPINIDEAFDSELTSSTDPSSSSPPESSTLETSSDGAPRDRSERQLKPKILPSQRFILSKPFSLYIRALAYQDKTEEIFQAVRELQAAGFKMTNFNWSVYVQMMAASDRMSDLLEAFKTNERMFMPRFPGWGPLRRGYILKTKNSPKFAHKLEDPRLDPRSIHRQSQKFLGKAARKHFSQFRPDLLSPTYVTMVYLAAALNRVRDDSILNGSSELEVLVDVAPKTIQALGNMPYWREKFQGVLARGRELGPDMEGAPIDEYVALGGVLGAGVEARPRKLPRGDHTEEQEFPYMDISATNEVPDSFAELFGSDDLEDAQESPLSREDLLDIEDDIRYHRRIADASASKRRREENIKLQKASHGTRKTRKPIRPVELNEDEELIAMDEPLEHGNSNESELHVEFDEPSELSETNEHDVERAEDKAPERPRETH